MSIIRITKENIENFSLITHPKRTFISSSSGITGSISLFVRNSPVLKDAVPNEDYGESVLQATSIEELRMNAVMDETRYYSHITGTILSFVGPSDSASSADIDIIDSSLFVTSSGMKAGWSSHKNSHILVFSGSGTNYFGTSTSPTSLTIPRDVNEFPGYPHQNEKVRYVTTTQAYGGNYEDIFVSYGLTPGPIGHTENLTGSHPASLLTSQRSVLAGISQASQRITSSNGDSLVQDYPTITLALQKSLTGAPGTWIDVRRHEPTYKDVPYTKNSSGKALQNVFNSSSFVQGVEKIYTSSVLHNETHASGTNGPWYFRLIQSASSGQVLDNASWAIRNFNIETKHTSGSARNILGPMTLLMEEINSSSISSTTSKKLEVTRFTPSTKFTKDTLRKNVIKNVLMPYYKAQYPGANYAFTNYHTLNFFTASSVPSNTALIYPAGTGSADSENDFSYIPHDGFTFEFWINPRYENDDIDDDFKAGTILHHSSSYAISLITGSSRGLNGLVDSYKIMLQLSHSADIAPSYIGWSPGGDMKLASAADGHKSDLIFTSSAFPKNHWTHAAMSWGKTLGDPGVKSQQYTGSFFLNGIEDTPILITSASVMATSYQNPQGDPDALFVGNYYNGPNNGNLASTPLLSRFFNANVSYEDGLDTMYPGLDYDTANQDPSHTDIPDAAFSLDHPLNAEVHEIRIWSQKKTSSEILTGSKVGVSKIPNDLMFYLPVLFVKETPSRDVLQTPFQSVRSTTDDPFNISLSFGVGGRHINLPNFTREFVKKKYPRLYHLTASTINDTTVYRSADYFLYESGSVIKSNLTVLPNDNGKFTPDFNLLVTGTIYDAEPSTIPDNYKPVSGSLMDRFVSDEGVLRMDLVSMSDIISTGSIFDGLYSDDEDAEVTGISQAIRGATPEQPGLAAGQVLTILDRTRDPSSNEVTFFDISNLFYGKRVMPNSFKIQDNQVTGSLGKVKLTFKDNGYGGLYRADTEKDHPTWANYGTIMYDEGLLVITDPTAIHFGKDHFQVDLVGENTVNVKEINVLAETGVINSSSNPNWKELKPTDYDHEQADKFVYITSVNLHDGNFDVIGRAVLAQPVVKRNDDKYLVRLKMDY